MKHSSEITIPIEAFKNPKINDELFFRRLAVEMMSKISLDELHKIINFKKIDPNSIISQARVLSDSTTHWEFDQIKDLKENDLIYYSAEINTDPKCKSKTFESICFHNFQHIDNFSDRKKCTKCSKSI